MSLGTPRVHYRIVDSTNARARVLAEEGAVHGTLVTAAEQTAGRGRHGRTWTAPPARALLCSVVVRDPPELLPLAAGVAVAEAASAEGAARASGRPTLKWPNDVLIDGRKVAGILIEGRPQEHWSVVGIGINVAVRESELPLELRARAGGLGLEPAAIEPTLARLLELLDCWIATPAPAVLAAVRDRDALLGERVRWAGGEGEAAGIDQEGRLVVAVNGGRVALGAGEVHLG